VTIQTRQYFEDDARNPLLTASIVLAASVSILAVLLLAKEMALPSRWHHKNLIELDGFSKTNGTAHTDIVIVGSERFQRQVRAALTLLMYRDRDDYLMVIKYLRRIKEAKHSGTQVHEIPPTLCMRRTTVSCIETIGTTTDSPFPLRFTVEKKPRSSALNNNLGR
jgi:hypothetical protein